MKIIRDYHEKLESIIGDNQYVSTDSEFNQFINEYIPDPNEDTYDQLRDMGNEGAYNGYNIPDVDDLISKVLCLYKNPQKRKRMGIYAKRLADIKYGPEENYKLLINIFANVLKEKGRK